MARNLSAKNTAEVVEAIASDSITDEGQTAEYVLAQAERAQGEQWKIHVYSIDEKTGDEGKLFSAPITDLEGLDDRLRDTYGTGVYKIMVYHRPEGQNLSLRFRTWTSRIIAPPKSAQPTQQASEMGVVLSTFDKLAQRMEAMMLRMTQPPAPAAAIADPLAQITQIVAAMKGLKELTGPPADPVMNISDAILKGIEIANKARGEAGNDDGGAGESWIGLARDLLKSPLTETIIRQSATALPAPAKPQTPPAGAPGAPEQAQPGAAQTQPSQEQAMQELRQKIFYLCTVAARGGDPALYAEWALDNIPREQIIGVLRQPNSLQLLPQFVPQSGPYIPWFGKLIEAIKELAEDAEGTAPKPNGQNAPSDVSPVQPLGNTGWGGGSESDFESDVGPN